MAVLTPAARHDPAGLARTPVEERWKTLSRLQIATAGRPEFFLGLDLGQRQDHTAIAVVTPVEEPEGPFDYVHWRQPTVRRLRVAMLERLPLGTRYVDVVRRVREICRRPEVTGPCTVVADATGVGLPVVEMLRAAQVNALVAPVLITGSGTANFSNGVWRVPRRDLLARLATAFEQGQVRVPRSSRWAGALVEEMLAMRRDRKDTAGVHDDLVFALALGVWRAR